MFALGEVVYIMIGKTVLSYMLIGMFICVGVFFYRICKRAAYICVFAMPLAGFICIGNGYVCDRLMELRYRESAGDGTYIKLQGIVDEVSGGNEKCSIVIKTVDGCRVIAYGVDCDLKKGQEILVMGNAVCPSRPTNPGAFDFVTYYKGRNICFSINIDQLTLLDASYNRMWQKLVNIRMWGIHRLEAICENGCAEYKGILFGDKSSISDRNMLIYRRSGIAHILAISGLHISIVSGFIYMLFRKMYMPTWLSAFTAIMTAFLYGALAGFGMSTVRALIMLTVAMLGNRLGKSVDMLTGLAAAVFIMLIKNPMSIMDTGMLLSAGAILGVCMGAYINKCLLNNGRIKKYFRKHRAAKYIMSSVIVSISINIVTFPIVAYFYYELPMYGFIINLFVVPCMSLVVVLGVVGIILSMLSLSIGRAFITPGIGLLKIFKKISEITLKLPFSTANTGKPSMWQIIVYYTILLVILAIMDRHMKEKLIRFLEDKRFKKIDRRKFTKIQHGLVILILCLVVNITICIPFIKNRESFVFLDVGQGDGVLISTPHGTVIAIDGGTVSMEGENLAKYILSPAAKSLKMADIDFWAVTHGDLDHVNGLIYILENYDVYGINIRCILLSEHVVCNDAINKIVTLSENNKIPIRYMNVGDMVTDGSADIVCCHPDRSVETEDTNDASLGLSYNGEKLSGLFLGDMSEEAIAYMFLHHGTLLENSYTCLKVPHHGSKNSLYEPLYADGKGEMAVISCGKNNLYGHPHSDVINMLTNEHIDIYRTDIHGAVIIR